MVMEHCSEENFSMENVSSGWNCLLDDYFQMVARFQILEDNSWKTVIGYKNEYTVGLN